MAKRLLLTYRDAADELRVCAKTVERLVQRGELRAVRIGRAVRLTPDELERYIAAQMADSEVAHG